MYKKLGEIIKMQEETKLTRTPFNRFLKFLEKNNSAKWYELKERKNIGYYTGYINEDAKQIIITGYLQSGQFDFRMYYTCKDELDLNYIKYLLFYSEHRVDDFNE